MQQHCTCINCWLQAKSRRHSKLSLMQQHRTCINVGSGQKVGYTWNFRSCSNIVHVSMLALGRKSETLETFTHAATLYMYQCWLQAESQRHSKLSLMQQHCTCINCWLQAKSRRHSKLSLMQQHCTCINVGSRQKVGDTQNFHSCSNIVHVSIVGSRQKVGDTRNFHSCSNIVHVSMLALGRKSDTLETFAHAATLYMESEDFASQKAKKIKCSNDSSYI